jgi:hypothetical protein
MLVDLSTLGDSVSAMRIPPSAIVMVLAVSVPLTLAIRDSTKERETIGSVSSAYEEDLAEARATEEASVQVQEARQERMRMEAEQRRDAEQKARQVADEKREAGLAVLRKVVGSTPATLGSLFPNIRVSAPLPADPRTVQTQIREIDPAGSVDVRIDADAKKLNAIDVTFSSLSRSQCQSELAVRWHDVGEDGVWLDPATHARAVVDGSYEACTLHFDAFETLPVWIGKLPLNTIGTPAKKLALDPSAYVSEHEIDWRGPGVGAGRHPANYTVSLYNGKVAQILVYCDTDAVSLEELHTALAARLRSQPTRTDTSDKVHYEWSGTVPVRLSEGAGSFSILIGKYPER